MLESPKPIVCSATTTTLTTHERENIRTPSIQQKTPFHRSVEKEGMKGIIKEGGGEERGVERGSSVYVTIKIAFGSNTTPC